MKKFSKDLAVDLMMRNQFIYFALRAKCFLERWRERETEAPNDEEFSSVGESCEDMPIDPSLVESWQDVLHDQRESSGDQI